MTRETNNIVIGLSTALIVFLLFFIFSGHAIAGDPHHTHDGGTAGTDGINGIDGQDGQDGQDGIPGIQGIAGLDGTNWLDENHYWSDDELDEAFAAATAMAGIDFDNTTEKLQLGLAIGSYGGEEQVAIGVGKVFNSDQMGDILFSFKTTIQEYGRDDNRPWVGSAVWKVNLP